MELSSEGRDTGKGMTDCGVKVENGDMLRIGDGVFIHFKRTLRIPNDNRTYYSLPPSLGYFPIRRVSDYSNKVPVPESWRRHGGVFLPMYQREAMWLEVSGRLWNPNAMKLAIGKMCALTGKPWSEELHVEPQDYLVLPSQPQWLDGINSGKDITYQFITMPSGIGGTVQRQVSDEEKHGGLQICVFEPNKAQVFPDATAAPTGGVELGLGAGAGAGGLRLWQGIRAAKLGPDVWDQSTYARVFVHLCSPALWRDITGEAPPESPVSAKTYASNGLPWFDVYDEGRERVDDLGPQVRAKVSPGFLKEQDAKAICRNVLARHLPGLTNLKELTNVPRPN